MRQLVFTVLQFYATVLIAQEKALPRTPYYWLKDARTKVTAKDTSGVFASLKMAVQTGLYDPQAILGPKAFIDILSKEQKENLEKGVLINRKRIEKPSALQIITTDIRNFWELFPHINDSSAKEKIWDKYILNGSVGLQTFYQIRMNNDLEKFIRKIKSIQKYYSSIRYVSNQFQFLKPQFVTAAKKLERLYPQSIFPPIYFLIGNLNNVGTVDGYAGLLIGTEHLCRHQEVDTSQLSDFDKVVLFDSSLAVPLITHEYVHIQQKNKTEETLLEYAIMEGAADFVTYLVTGKFTDTQVYSFGFSNEQMIWEHFQQEMNGDNFDNWLFNTYNPKTGYPGNLGYFIGYRICESFYQKSTDKRQAIKEILQISDFKEFLSKSGYTGL
ncbi:MAG TPA: DUF2268 domain-containing putative Zn-dependent protease [Chitinophagaceae bacterium]|nr:DUF2268 domain-containing putative Zn-dependent protease [Chitinophagaceae bacterium]